MKRLFSILSGALFLSSTLTAWAAGDRGAAPPISFWQGPAFYTPPHSGRTALTDAAPPMPYIPLVPCRQYNSLSFTKLADNTPRTVMLSGAPCGIPASAAAVAVNITIFNIVAFANGVFRADTVSPPTVAWINYPPTEAQRGNAGVLSLAAGAIVVQVNQGGGNLDFVVDVFGYYGPSPANAANYFTLNTNSTGSTMFLTNSSTTCTGACGVYQDVHHGIAIWGETSGGGNGIDGINDGNAVDSAGVFGIDGAGAGTPSGFFSAGVRGEGKDGVLGITNTSGGVGVHGQAAAPATWGVFALGNLGATGTKPFVEPHPTDPTMVIRYVALEGPEAGTYFRGTGRTVNGEAVIEVPDTFRIVSAEEGLTVQLTPVGELAQMAVMSQDLNQIVVRSSRDVAFHYHVNGIRRAFKDWQVVAEGNEFRPVFPDQKMPSAYTEEAKSRLIANGTYNPDGTVNMRTAERLGWVKTWREEAAEAAAAAAVKHN